MRETLYVIEARTPAGTLDLTHPQPEHYFGMKAIKGVTADEIAGVIFRHCEQASLNGGEIASWPSHIDPRFVARIKYWKS